MYGTQYGGIYGVWYNPMDWWEDPDQEARAAANVPYDTVRQTSSTVSHAASGAGNTVYDTAANARAEAENYARNTANLPADYAPGIPGVNRPLFEWPDVDWKKIGLYAALGIGGIVLLSTLATGGIVYAATRKNPRGSSGVRAKYKGDKYSFDASMDTSDYMAMLASVGGFGLLFAPVPGSRVIGIPLMLTGIGYLGMKYVSPNTETIKAIRG